MGCLRCFGQRKLAIIFQIILLAHATATLVIKPLVGSCFGGKDSDAKEHFTDFLKVCNIWVPALHEGYDAKVISGT